VSTTTVNSESFVASGTPLPGMKQFGMIAGVLGVVLAVAGFFMSGADRFFQAYLVAYTFWMGVIMGAMALLMEQHLSGGVWGIILRRPFETAVRTLPIMTVLFIPIAFGMHSLYEWARPEAANDAGIQAKALYLNTPFFLVRQAIYFALWNVMGFLLTKWSAEHDRTGDPALLDKLSRLSGAGLLIYGLTMTFAAVDWTMSVNPHWFSTIWGMLYVGGQGLSDVGAIDRIVLDDQHGRAARVLDQWQDGALRHAELAGRGLAQTPFVHHDLEAHERANPCE